MSTSQANIRKDVRAKRRSLSPRDQINAANRLAELLTRHTLFLSSRKIAFYWPNDGEIDPTPALLTALSKGKSCYLPVLYRGGENRLIFGKTFPDSSFSLNKFGIPEPDIATNGWAFSIELDLILAPLVAFDTNGNRIGMGGGFYDRSLKQLLRNRNWYRPHILGLAHEFQHVDSIGTNAWDIPLRGAVTDKQIFNFEQ